MQKEPLSLFMTKNVMRGSLIVGITLVFGVAGYLAMNKDNLGGLSKSDIEEGNNFAIDETADWKTYTNEEYGFELKYPNGWFLYEDGDNVYFQPDEEVEGNIPGPHASALSVRIEKLSEDENLEQKIKTDKNRAGMEFEQSKIMIGGENAFLVKSICEGVGCGSPEWYFVKDEYLYSFNSNLGYSPAFDRIISTFKFIEKGLASCSKEGDLSLLKGAVYPLNKAKLVSKELFPGGSFQFFEDTFKMAGSSFVLEGVNVPEANKITVQWSGDEAEKQVANFERGDTHWCFDISEDSGNVKAGANVYTVRIYFDADEIIEYKITAIGDIFRGEIEDEEVLHVDWFSAIKKTPVENFLSEVEMEGIYANCLINNTKEVCYGLFSFYKAGTVSGGKYKGYDYYLVSSDSWGMGGESYYRIIYKPSDGRLILIEEYSNEPVSSEKGYFVLAKNITIDNLIPKVEIPIPDSSYVLESHSESPNILFSEITEGLYFDTSEKIFSDVDAGDIYLENSDKTFFVRVSDGSAMAYRIKLPFVENREESSRWNTDDLLLDIKFIDGKQNTEYYAHGSRYQFVCAAGDMYDIVSDDFIDVNTQLGLVGTSPFGDKFYEINDEKKIREIYDNKRTIPYGGLSADASYVFSQDITFEEFKALHPLLFWKDPFGRWVQFTNNIFTSAAECGGGYGRSAL